MAPNESKELEIVSKILKEVLEIQKQHAFDPVFGKTERQKLVIKAIDKVFKLELD